MGFWYVKSIIIQVSNTFYMKYTLLTSCLKGLSQDTYFFITGFHILILHKNLPKTKHLFCLLGFGSTNFIFWVLINESEIRGVTHTLICLQSEVICSKILEAWYPHDNCQYQSEVSGVYASTVSLISSNLGDPDHPIRWFISWLGGPRLLRFL